MTIQDGLTFVLLYLVEDGKLVLAVNDRIINVDDHITIYVTCVIATAIDVTTLQTTVQVLGCAGGWPTCCHWCDILTGRSTDGIPL